MGLAVLGAELGLQGHFGVEDLDLNSQRTKEAGARYEAMSLDELNREIANLRSAPWTKIPRRRWRIIRFRVSGFITSAIGGIWPAVVRCIPKRLRTLALSASKGHQ